MIMALEAIIDLLSTDDESPAQLTSLKKKTATTDFRLKSESLFLSDSPIGEDFASNDWSESAPKRRKLTESPPLQDKTCSSTSASLALLMPKNNRKASELSDDIIFTSSAGIAKAHSRSIEREANLALTDESEDELPDDIFSIGKDTVAPQISGKAASFLAKVKGKHASVSRKTLTDGKTTAKRKPPRISSLSPRPTHDNNHSDENTQPLAKPARKLKLTDEEKASKAEEREA